MIVANAQIAMATQYEYYEHQTLRESISFWSGADSAPTNRELTPQIIPAVQVDLSKAGSLLAKYQYSQKLNLESEMDSRSRLNLMILEAIFEAISSRPLNLKESKEIATEEWPKELKVETSLPQRRRQDNKEIIYRRHEHYEEHERLQFQSQGIIHTQDGREISFNVDLTMSRSFVQESHLELRPSAMKDPLVINFDGQGAQLSQTKFSFDLDSDGASEQLAILKTGSGFLALDRNSDNQINNGTELFGLNTGSGFSELAQYDEDGNQFIDETDSIYHQLRIWMINEDGSTQLMALGDKNIGAIFLGHVSSPFQLKDDNNNSLGEIANSGIYLKETGEVGVVQELNLSV